MSYQPRQTIHQTQAGQRSAPIKWARRFLALSLAVSLVSIGLLNNAQADNCALDPTFGNGGKVITSFGQWPHHAIAFAAALQSDGKIVAAGWANVDPSNGPNSADFALVRYNTDGTLDNTFGNGGIVTTDFSGLSDRASAIVIQSDDKIIVGGGVDFGIGMDDDFGLARYNSDGSLDDGTANDSTPGDSFGNGGKVTLDFFGFSLFDMVNDLALQQDGKLVVVGTASKSSQIGQFEDIDFALVRYNTDGSLDDGTANDSTPGDSFGNGGKTSFDFFNGPDEASSVAIQPADGKIVVGGSGLDPVTSKPNFALARYNTNGTLDPAFGSGGGVLMTDFGNYDSIVDIAIQSDNKIVALGSTFANNGLGPFIFALARYNSDGNLDNTFGSGGKVVTDFPGAVYGNIPTSMALQPDGRIVAAGWIARANIPAQNNESFALARYNTNGQLDNTFDGDGKTITDFFGSEDEANDVLILPDGNIVAVGASYTHGTYHFALARHLGDAADYPATLDSLTLNINSLPGSGFLSGTVKLCGPAPAGGVKITIKDTLAAVTVPQFVTVPAGQTTVTFTLKTRAVLETESGNVIAKLGATSKSAQLVIKSIGLFAIGLEPNPAQGPNTVRGAVVLNGRAPEGGITVTLSSRNPAIASPTVSSLFIPAGAQQKNFTLRTSDVTSPRSVIITATANGTSKSSVLTVN